MNYSRNLSDEFKRFFRSGSMLSILILINLLIWVLTKVVYVIFYLYNHPDVALADNWILHYFALPANPEDLISRPWTVVTYMFLHIDFWHILFNMLWLFWFGRIFMEYLSSRHRRTPFMKCRPLSVARAACVPCSRWRGWIGSR